MAAFRRPMKRASFYYARPRKSRSSPQRQRAGSDRNSYGPAPLSIASPSEGLTARSPARVSPLTLGRRMQNTEAVIRSAKDGTTLTFRLLDSARPKDEERSFEVTIESPDVRARVIASTYYAGSPALLFRKIAQNWKGWKDESKWASLEGEFTMSARSDSLGHVTLEVALRSDTYPPEWKMNGLIHLEAGSLDSIARSVASILPIAENASYEG